MKKLTILALVFVYCAVIARVAIGSDKLLTLAADNYSDKGKNIILLFHERIISEAFAHSGYSVNFLYKPWKRVLAEVKAGMLEGAYTAWYTEDRSKVYEYSNAYFDEGVFFYKRLGSSIAYNGELRSMTSYRIGMLLGWALDDELEEADELKIIRVNSPFQLVSMLNSNRIDLMVISEPVMQMNTKIANLTEKITPPLKRNSNHVVFSKKIDGYERKRDAFNEGFEIIKVNGVLRELEKEYRLRSGLLH